MKKNSIMLLALTCLLAGCAYQTENTLDEKAMSNEQLVTDRMESVILQEPTEEQQEKLTQENEKLTQENENLTAITEQIKEVDFSQYFEELNGCAVFYKQEAEQEEYFIYNKELSEFASSPCSTFKIISLLMGLEDKVITQENSMMEWNQTKYWNEEWNQNLNYKQAFQSSCVWYYRELINCLKKENVQNFLQELEYGNCDISDWEGRLNLNNSNRDLTGFWIESSLRISPKEQTEVLSRIFGRETVYSKENIELLQEAMQIDNGNSAVSIYGKTGTGIQDGKCIDAWFVGMFEIKGSTTYFAIRLDDPEKEVVSSKKAKEIGINIINEYFAEGLKIS